MQIQLELDNNSIPYNGEKNTYKFQISLTSFLDFFIGTRKEEGLYDKMDASPQNLA